MSAEIQPYVRRVPPSTASCAPVERRTFLAKLAAMQRRGEISEVWTDAATEREARETGRFVVRYRRLREPRPRLPLYATLSAAALFLGARAAEPLTAILCLSLAVGLLMSSEGPFWSTVTEAAWPHSGAAGGVMNTAGNLAGVVSTAVTPLMVKWIGWTGTFLASAAMLLTAGLLWFLIRTERK